MSLDEKDRNWIAAELANVRLGIERVETSLAAEMVKVRGDIERSLAAEVAKVRVDIERVETSLLTEFHKWASPMEMRVKSHSLALRALDLETESLSERVEKLEPPH
jgi:hypothetical protein